MEHWAPQGIAGRGVLVDYDSWAGRNNVQYDRLSSHPIRLHEVKAILEESKVTLRKGDILLLRTGEYSLQRVGRPNKYIQGSSGHIANLKKVGEKTLPARSHILDLSNLPRYSNGYGSNSSLVSRVIILLSR